MLLIIGGKNYRKEVGLGYKKDVVSVTAGNVSEFIEQLSGLIAIWYGAYLVINSKLTVGQLLLLEFYQDMSLAQSLGFRQFGKNIQEALLLLQAFRYFKKKFRVLRRSSSRDRII